VTFDSVAIFNWQLDKAIYADVQKSGYPVEQWMKAGVQHPQNTINQWREKGPKLVDRFIGWFESSDYQVWITPDGRPAIELELRPVFGEIEVVMYIDLILQNKLGLTVVDSKSGSVKPASPQQLGMYACGVELTYGIRPLYGAYYRAQGTGPKGCSDDDKTYFQEPKPLSAYHYSVEFFTRELAMMDRGVNSGVFVAKVGPDCARCEVAAGCLAVGGDLAAKFDPAHPAHSMHQGS
jgi:hypothetical protein